MTIRFGSHPDVVFGNDLLTAVLCQVRFEPVLSLASDQGALGLQEALRAEYPSWSQENAAQISMTETAVGIKKSFPVFKLADEDQNWAVYVAVDFVALEVQRYSDFGEFRRRSRRVFDVVARTVAPSKSTRVGLRKINRLDPNVVSNWTDAFQPQLVGVLAEADFAARAGQSVQVTELDVDGATLRVLAGVPDGADGAFVLDLDCYSEQRVEIADDSPLIDLLDEYSKTITSFFHWSLQPDFAESLAPRLREDG